MNSECSKGFSPVLCYEGRAWKKENFLFIMKESFIPTSMSWKLLRSTPGTKD